MTNSLGDMLRELRDPNLSLQRLDEIVRLFNEVGDREQKYKSWTNFAGSNAVLKSSIIYDPNWRTSPLHVFDCLLTTDTQTQDNTYKYITFDNGVGDKSIFDFYQGDKSKIQVDRSQINTHFEGTVNWAANGVGFREAMLDVYNKVDTLLASQLLHKIPAVTGNITSAPFVFTANILYFFPDAAYARLKVAQNSGGVLNVTNIILSVMVA